MYKLSGSRGATCVGCGKYIPSGSYVEVDERDGVFCDVRCKEHSEWKKKLRIFNTF